MQIGRIHSALAGAAVGAASALVPGAGSIAAAGVAQGATSYALDRLDPIRPFRPTPLPWLAGVGQGLATGVAAYLAGPLAGAAVGALLGALRWGQRPPATTSALGLASMGVPALQARGLTGKGVGVAVLDSGCAPHPAYASRLVAFHDAVAGKEAAYDADVHGTAVSGLIAGQGVGVAPQAHLVAVRVADDEHGVESSTVLKALEWVQQHRQRYNIQVVNLSFGLEDSGMLKVLEKLKEFREQGVIVVTSAGNDGPQPRRFTAFKSCPDVLTVGASHTRGTVDPADDRLAPFSSRAKAGSPKGPDLVVPSDHLVSTGPDGGLLQFADGQTSLAAARASGIVALWKQADPSLRLEQIQEALRHTSVPLANEDRLSQGYGLVQADRALQFITQA